MTTPAPCRRQSRLSFCRSSTWGLLALSLGWAGVAGAQAVANPVAMPGVSAQASAAAPQSLKGYLQMALSQHPEVLRARQQSQAAQYELEGARWSRYPNVSAEATGQSKDSEALLRVQYPLWTGGRLDAQEGVADANARAAERGVHEAQTNVLLQSGTVFFEVIRLEARLNTAQDNVRAHEQLVAMIQRRAEVEVSPTADLVLAQARLQQALAERLQLQRQLDAARVTLSQWVGQSVGPLATPAALRLPRQPDISDMLTLALDYSAQRQRLQRQFDSARAQVQLAQAQLKPTLVLGYQHILAGVPLGADRGKAYVAMQYQSGSGLSALSAVQAALSRQQAAEFDIETHQRQLSAEVRAAINDITGLLSQDGPAQALLSGTEEVVSSYLRQYQIGRKNWLDVLNAQREKNQAVYNAVDVRFGLEQAKWRLLVLTGQLTPESLTLIHD